MFFCSLAITKIQLFIEKLLFLPYYFGVGNFSNFNKKKKHDEKIYFLNGRLGESNWSWLIFQPNQDQQLYLVCSSGNQRGLCKCWRLERLWKHHWVWCDRYWQGDKPQRCEGNLPLFSQRTASNLSYQGREYRGI